MKYALGREGIRRSVARKHSITAEVAPRVTEIGDKQNRRPFKVMGIATEV